MQPLDKTEIVAVRNFIKKATVGPIAWRNRLKTILARIRPIIPFDRATFGTYAENGSLFRPVHIETSTPAKWPSLWIEVPDELKLWLSSGQTWTSDLEQFVRSYPSYTSNPVVREHLDAGLQSFVTLPVPGPDGTSSSLTLASKAKATYDQGSLALLDELDLAHSLLVFEREITTERFTFRYNAQQALRSSSSLAEAADILVRELRRFFRWDHISIISIDNQKRRFQLLAQGSELDCGLPINFHQPLDVGMLAATLQQNPTTDVPKPTALIVEDTRIEPRKYNYTVINPRLLSAMTLPLQLGGEWRWVILAESSLSEAFHGPDIEDLAYVISEVETELNHLYVLELYKMLLEKTPDGVIVVGPTGKITHANRPAIERFLGAYHRHDRLSFFDERTNGPRFADCAADSTSKDIIEGRLADTSRRLVLIGPDQNKKVVLATRHDLPSDFQSSVWFLTDLDNLDWNAEYRYLRAVVNDVAQQARGPLMLAALELENLITQFEGETRAKIHRSAQNVLAEISKADISFERLADRLAILKQPLRQRERISANELIGEIVKALPDRDLKHIDLKLPSTDLWVEGDKSRIRFVFRSIIEYLLRRRADHDGITKDIHVGVTGAAAHVKISLEILNSKLELSSVEPSSDALWASVLRAQEDTGLGLEAINEVINAHGGTLEKLGIPSTEANPAPNWVCFKVSFPLATGADNP